MYFRYVISTGLTTDDRIFVVTFSEFKGVSKQCSNPQKLNHPLSKLAHIHNKNHLTLHRKSSLGWKTLTTPKEFMMPEWCRGLVATVRMFGPNRSFIHRKSIKRGWESQTLLRKRWWCLCKYFHAYVPAAGHVETRPGGSFPKIGPRGQRWAY